jgi:hypothetical protein
LTELHTFFGFGKGDRQMGSQVNEKKREREIKKERKKEEEEKRRKREQKKRKKRARSLDEWILSKLNRQKDKFFFTKLTMQNIEEFCFVSIIKRGHLLLPNFLSMF